MRARAITPLIASGVPVDYALSVAALHDPRLLAALRLVREGRALSEAITAAPEVFDAVWVWTVREGENRASIDTAMVALDEYDRLVEACEGAGGARELRLLAALRTLLRAGLLLSDAVAVALHAAGFPSETCDRASERISAGERLDAVLRAAECLDSFSVDLIRVAAMAESLAPTLDWLTREALGRLRLEWP